MTSARRKSDEGAAPAVQKPASKASKIVTAAEEVKRRNRKTTIRGTDREKTVQRRTQTAKREPMAEAVCEPVATPAIEEGSAFALFDETLLDVCRTRWQFGDWSRLAAIDPETLLHHPDRGKVALLVASALFQLGQHHHAHRVLQLALDWGASHRQAAQMLISGTHQSLAEAHLLINRHEPAREHFREAIRTGGVPGDADLLAQARALRRNSFAS